MNPKPRPFINGIPRRNFIPKRRNYRVPPQQINYRNPPPNGQFNPPPRNPHVSSSHQTYYQKKNFNKNIENINVENMVEIKKPPSNPLMFYDKIFLDNKDADSLDINNRYHMNQTQYSNALKGYNEDYEKVLSIRLSILLKHNEIETSEKELKCLNDQMEYVNNYC